MLSDMSRFTKTFILLLVLLPGLLIGISGLILATEHQEKQGLKGKYYPNPHWEGAPSVSQRDKVPYLNGAIGYNLLATDRYSVKWKGWIAIKRSGTYRFATHSDGGSLLQIDEQLVVDNGGTHGLKNVSGEIYLEKGAYSIEILYDHSGGESVLEVFWTPPGTAEQPLPAEVLFSERPEWTIGGMVRTVESAKGFIFICYSLLLLVILIVLITILRPSTCRNEDRGMPENVALKLQNDNRNASQLDHRIHLLILILLPFFLLILNRNVFISNVFHSKIDSWIYFGYFLNLPQHLKMFTGMFGYFGDRLAFLIPGYLSYKIFPPVLADYVLHFGFYYTALFSLYSILKLSISKKVAFFTALLFGSYYYTLWMYSWNHVDGAANTYFLLTVLFITKARVSPKRQIPVLFAGIFFASMLFTGLQAIKLIPGITIYFFLCFYRIAPKKLLSAEKTKGGFLELAFYFLLGLLVANVLFSIINYLLTNDFFVLRESLELIRKLRFIPPPLPLKQLLSTYWLILPIIVLVIFFTRTVCQITSKSFRISEFDNVFQICFFVSVATFLLAKIRGSIPVPYLTISCQFSYLTASLFLAIGDLSSSIINKVNAKYFYTGVSVGFLTFIAPVIYINSSYESSAKGPSLVAEAMRTIQSVEPKGTISFLFNAPDKDLDNRCGYPKFYVHGDQDNLTEVFHNVASTYLWKQYERIFSDRLEISANHLPHLKENMKIVILTNNRDDLHVVQDAFTKLGVATHLLTEKTVQEDDISFKMIFLEITYTPSGT